MLGWKKIVAVAASAAAGSVMLAGTAQAAPADGSRMLVFADSVAAGTNMMITPDDRNCLHGEASWPGRVAGAIGAHGDDLLDASCYGAGVDTGMGWWLSDQARYADEQGAIGPRTELVLINLGMNDSWGNGVGGALQGVERCGIDLINGCDRGSGAAGRMPNPAAITPQNYADRTAPVVDYIKHYAPDARIAIVGYPEMTAQRGDEMCVQVAGLPVVQPRGGGFVEYFDALDDAQRGAADILGVDFVDMRAAFDGHGPCAADPWVGGLLAPTDPLQVPFHLTRQGEAVAAQTIVDQLGL